MPDRSSSSGSGATETRRAGRDQSVALVVAALTAGCAALGFVHLGHSLSYDETFSLAIAKGPWVPLLRGEKDPSGILYNALLKLWSAFAGDGERSLRSLSVLLAAGSVPALYITGKALVGRPAALAASGLLAVNSFLLTQAQNARAYALVLLLTIISTALFVRAVDEDRPWLGLLHGLVIAMAVYAHFFAVFVLVAQWAALLATRRRVPRGLLAGSLGAFVLCLPLVAIVRSSDLDGISWIPRTTVASVVGVFSALSGGRFLLVVVTGLCSITALRWCREWRRSLTHPSLQPWLVSSWLVLPLALAVTVSLYRPLVVNRYFVILLPPIALAAGAGLVELWRWRRPVAALALAGLVMAMPGALLRAYGQRSEDWKGAVEYLLARSGPGRPAAVIVDYHLIPIEHYLRHRLPVSRPPFADLEANAPPCILLTYWAVDSQTARLLRTDAVRHLFDRYRSVDLVPLDSVSIDVLQRKDAEGVACV